MRNPQVPASTSRACAVAPLAHVDASRGHVGHYMLLETAFFHPAALTHLRRTGCLPQPFNHRRLQLLRRGPTFGHLPGVLPPTFLPMSILTLTLDGKLLA